jgi:quinol monooxygenase YgiN
MSKVIQTVSYDINPGARERFLPLLKAMKEHNTSKDGIVEYSVYENKLKPNSFTELYVFSSVDEFEKMEEEDNAAVEFTAKVKSMLAGGKMRYSTLIEV